MTLLQYLDNLQNKNTNCNTVSCVNKLVTVFAKPYLDSLPNTDNLQSSNTFRHRNAIPEPAARDGANTEPYLACTGIVPGPIGTSPRPDTAPGNVY
jgi:hypothetical protein